MTRSLLRAAGLGSLLALGTFWPGKCGTELQLKLAIRLGSCWLHKLLSSSRTMLARIAYFCTVHIPCRITTL